MDKIVNFKISLSILLSALLVTLSYELKDFWKYQNDYFFIMAIIASYILSNLLAVFISNLLLENRQIRKSIFGKRDIEGVWRFQTENAEESNFGIDGILKISYDNKQHSFKVVGRRTDKNGNEINTNSIFSKYDFKTGEYLNVTEIYDGKEGITKGLAYGSFFSDFSSNRINKFNGIFLVEGKDKPAKFFQSAKREKIKRK